VCVCVSRVIFNEKSTEGEGGGGVNECRMNRMLNKGELLKQNKKCNT